MWVEAGGVGGSVCVERLDIDKHELIVFVLQSHHVTINIREDFFVKNPVCF